MLNTNRPDNSLIALVDAVTRVQGRLKSAFAASRDAVGLGEMEMTVLNAVVEAARAPTVPQIGRSLGHPRQVIQRAANQLIGTGLIAVADNPEHKRAVLLVATPAGLAAKKEANARAEELSRSILASVDEGVVRAAADNLAIIRSQLEAWHRKEDRK